MSCWVQQRSSQSLGGSLLDCSLFGVGLDKKMVCCVLLTCPTFILSVEKTCVCACRTLLPPLRNKGIPKIKLKVWHRGRYLCGLNIITVRNLMNGITLCQLLCLPQNMEEEFGQSLEQLGVFSFSTLFSLKQLATQTGPQPLRVCQPPHKCSLASSPILYMFS